MDIPPIVQLIAASSGYAALAFMFALYRSTKRGLEALHEQQFRLRHELESLARRNSVQVDEPPPPLPPSPEDHLGSDRARDAVELPVARVVVR